MTAQKSQHTELFYQKDATTIVKVTNITGVTGTGGAKSQIEATNLDSTAMEYIDGLTSPGSISAPLNFDMGNQVHRDLFALHALGNQQGQNPLWIIGYSDDYPTSAPPTIANGVITYPPTRSFISFNGYISDFPIDAALNSKLETSMTIQRSGSRVALPDAAVKLLRSLAGIAALLGAPIQAHAVSYGGKNETLHFKQFSDEVGAGIFALHAGETVEARGERIFNSVIAESLCDAQGELAGTEAEVAALPKVFRALLWDKAALTNNLVVPKDESAPDAEASGKPKRLSPAEIQRHEEKVRNALALRMGMPRLLLSRVMPYSEFLDWSRLFAREPFDDERCFDRPSAQLAWLFVNSKIGKNDRPAALADFLPFRIPDESAEDGGESLDDRITRLI